MAIPRQLDDSGRNPYGYQQGQRDDMGLSAGAWANLINSHQPPAPPAKGGGGGGGGGYGGYTDFLKELISAGANPALAAHFITLNASNNPTDALASKQDIRGMFSSPGSARGSLDYMRPQGGHSSGTTSGSMSMPSTPSDPYWTGGAMRQRRDEDARAIAMQNAQQNSKLALLQHIMSLTGGGSGGGNRQITTRGEKDTVFNNAGAPQIVPTNYSETRDTTPQEQNQYLESLLRFVG